MGRWGVVLLLAGLWACGDDDGDGLADASAPLDAQSRDAGERPDGSAPPDAAEPLDDQSVPDCDEDDDGHEATRCGGDDCDDTDPTINPGERDDPWIEELVVRDGAFTTARSISSGVTSDGVFHVAYAVGGRVSYAVGQPGELGAPGTWADEVVEEVNRDLIPVAGGALVNLAVAPDDTIHLLYTGVTAARHAVRNGAGWDIETVDVAQVTHGARTMVVDGAGALHVVFELELGDSSDLAYATNTSGTWVRHDLTTADDDGHAPSIAIGAAGVPHVSHDDRTNDRIIHSWREGGVWTSETIRSEISPTGITGLTWMSTLAVGAGGELHALVPVNREPIYLRRVAGEWTDPANVGSDRFGVFPELALSASGAVHAAFTGVSSGDTRIGYATDELGTWSGDTLPPTARSSRVALSLDLEGNPVVFFASSDDDELAVLFRRHDGIDQDCDGVGD